MSNPREFAEDPIMAAAANSAVDAAQAASKQSPSKGERARRTAQIALTPIEDGPHPADQGAASAREALRPSQQTAARFFSERRRRGSQFPPLHSGHPIHSTGANLMGIFSRTRDIIAANFNDLLDRADDPAKMIRMIIAEMEETLVDVRASAARTIADQKEIKRHVNRLDALADDWASKAQLALSKNREDLARAALIEKQKAGEMAEQLRSEGETLNDALRDYEVDIDKLQARLREARSRQTSIAARLESAENRVKMRSLMTSDRVHDAMSRFDQLERRVDHAEGRADALSLADGSSKPNLADEISALAGADAIDQELEAMKAALGQAGKAPTQAQGE